MQLTSIFYQNWEELARTLVVSVLAYAVLIILLRVSGKRTLSKWNSFDFVVTVAFGSTLATILVSKEVSLTQGALAFALLVLLQFVITWLSVRVGFVRHWVKARPTLLMLRGEFRDQALLRQRVTRGEVLAALRSGGVATLDDAYAVVLETDGSFSVIKESDGEGRSTLLDVEGYDRADVGLAAITPGRR